MQGKDVAKVALESTQHMVTMFLGDLSDGDLLVNPVPKANNIAWQLGHLIASEKMLLEKILPGVNYPELSATLVSQGNAKSSTEVPPGGFLKKDAYLDWFAKVRNATIAAVEKLTDKDLDKPTEGGMAKFAPNLGSLLILIGNHTLMHAGQFSVVRRALNKPVIF